MSDQPVPKKSAQLTDEQRTKAIAWLLEKWGNARPCPFHEGPTTWGLGQLIVGVPAFIPIGGAPLAKVYPCVVVTCNVCAYTVLLNAIPMGLVTPEEPEPQTAPTPEPLTAD
jgi:hypothetical protein